MECRHIHKKLIFYLEKELNVSEAAAFSTHLENCGSCRLLAEKLANSLQLLSTDKLIQTNPFFVSRVMAKLENQAKEAIGWNWLRKPQFAFQAILYVLTIAISLLAGIYLGSGTKEPVSFTLNNNAENSDYQLFADSYNYQFNKNTYQPVISEDEE
jgi:predicted anti-sigma-YlaC factor YlaD